MKRGNISHWTSLESCENLLFFAQLVDELLFDYSIPSNRISTLNSHYLCLDALSAIHGITNNGVPEGTLKPIMEELFSEVQKDPVFSDGIPPKAYFVKTQDEKLRIVGQVTEMNYGDLKRTASSLNRVFFEDGKYYLAVKDRIIEIILQNDVSKQLELFRLTKSMLTELMNSGYCLRYLYMVMKRVFGDNRQEIESADKINDFFGAFDMKDHQYIVIFKVQEQKAYKFARFIENLELMQNISFIPESYKANEFFKLKENESFIQIRRKALDPFSAADKARDLLEDNTAVYRLYDHDYEYKLWESPCGIFDEKMVFFTDNHIINAVQHTKLPSEKQIEESMDVVGKVMSEMASPQNIRDLFSLLNAIRFHSHSLDSYAEDNQLLDLWAIFETILDISNKHTSDRIQQICFYLVPLLKKKYIFSLFDQLADDIKNYDTDLFNRIVGDEIDRKAIVQKVCEFVLLKENAEERQTELLKMRDFPLLKERIQYYTEKLSTLQSVHQFVEKHADRVKWQIMRIYRNRNLIIHNGKSMPYLPLLIENLHSYVDDFLAYTIHSLAKGHTIESMCQELFISECNWNEEFSKKKTTITADNIKTMLSM